MRRVYFIKPIGMTGPVKIGCSRSPEQRRNSLSTWSPFPLEIIAEVEGDELLERRFHAKFLGQWKHREWFDWSAEMEATVTAINDGAFDLDTLPEAKRLPFGSGAKKGCGRKWTEKEKADARLRRQFQKIERELGLVLPWPRDEALEAKFLDNPHRYGITVEERRLRWQKQMAENELARAEAAVARLKAAA